MSLKQLLVWPLPTGNNTPSDVMSYCKSRTTSLLKTPVFEVEKNHFTHDTEPSGDRWVVKHPGAVVILPIDSDNCLYLVRQYRFPIEKELLEFPAGCMEKGESPLETAKRELAEEIQLQAACWMDLGMGYPSPGFTNERLFLFVAKELSSFSLPKDEDENISLEKIPLSTFEKQVYSGEIEDLKSCMVFLKARALMLC